MPFVLDQPVRPFWRKTGATSAVAIAVALPVGTNVVKVWVDVASLVAVGTTGTVPSVTATDAVQTITTPGTPTSGAAVYGFLGQSTSALQFNCSAATFDTAFELISTVGTNGVVSAGGALPTAITVTFSGTRFTGTPVPLITVVSSTFDVGRPSIAMTTAGANPYAYMEASTQEQYTVANEYATFLYIATVTGAGNYRVSAYV